MAEEKYKVKLETNGKTITKTAESIYDALTAMDLTWDKIKGKGVITVSQGDKTREKVFNAPLLRRLFGNKDFRALWANRLKYLLG